jgi:hypothetical protein
MDFHPCLYIYIQGFSVLRPLQADESSRQGSMIHPGFRAQDFIVPQRNNAWVVVYWKTNCIWVNFGSSREKYIWVYLGCSWIVRERESNCQGFFLQSSNVFFIISAASATAMCSKI